MKNKWSNWTLSETESQIDKWVWKGKHNNTKSNNNRKKRIQKLKGIKNNEN